MKLDCIVSMASNAVRLRFLAMERSLRRTGCTLPLKVIPYNEERFALPDNAAWWEVPELTAWLKKWNAHPTMRKYQCLLIPNFQFVDADVCFLRNPVEVLAPLSGFVTSCGHWHNPGDTLTGDSQAIFARMSTTWQKSVFNTGQWACDRALYTLPELIARSEQPEYAPTCLQFPFHEQPGVNLLVLGSGVSVQNLTLPPWNMQSTWAGDYPGEYRSYWRSVAETPYLIHWAGIPMHVPRPINELYEEYLSKGEREEWQAQVARDAGKRLARQRSLRSRVRRLRNAFRAFFRTVHSG